MIAVLLICTWLCLVDASVKQSQVSTLHTNFHSGYITHTKAMLAKYCNINVHWELHAILLISVLQHNSHNTTLHCYMP